MNSSFITFKRFWQLTKCWSILPRFLILSRLYFGQFERLLYGIITCHKNVMKSFAKTKKVNRKPLFKSRIIVEGNHCSGNQSVTASYDVSGHKRAETDAQDNFSVFPINSDGWCTQGDVGPVKEETNRKEYECEQQISLSYASDSEKVYPDTIKQLNVRRKRPSKRMRCSLDDSPSKTTQNQLNDILGDEFFCASATGKGCLQSETKDSVMSDKCSMNTPKEESNASICSTTGTPIKMLTSGSDSLDVFASLIHNQSKNGKTLCDDSIVLYVDEDFDKDDSQLASLDVSDIVSSHNLATDNLQSEKDGLTFKAIKPGSHLKSNSDNLMIPSNTSKQPLPSHQNLFYANNESQSDCDIYEKTAEEELFYGLPLAVRSLIKKYKGIEKLYDWQNDCLNLSGLQKRKNLIYSLPTSGGKTLVAEILIMKELLCNGNDALLILPFVSIVQEKVRDLSLFAVDLEFLVEEYAASKGKFPPRRRRKKRSLYVATIEKANGLVNSLIEENRLQEIGLVVVDELHMLGEGGHRGATLEMCLAKLLYCSVSTQIIGMSATLNNIEDLQRFLNADKYTNDFRPVELREFFKIGEEMFEIKTDKIGRNEEFPFKRSRRIKHQTNDKKVKMNDPDHLYVLAQEVIPRYSCLFFCPTKRNCQNVAVLLTEGLPGELKKYKAKEKNELMRALKSNADGLCPVLHKVIPYGIGYHHSGLTTDERKLIEEAYSQGTLCLLTCTSTLAAGVNLPAKRVVLRAPYVGMQLMSRSQYKQMTGRAGRAGYNTSGESILVVDTKDKQKVMDLIKAPLESCHSSLLHNNGQGLRSLVLSLIGLKVCNSLEQVKRFISGTLFAVQNDSQGNTTLLEKINDNIDLLVALKLVKKCESVVDDSTVVTLETTHLGRATFKGCIDVDRSPFIYEEINRALQSLVLSNDLHLLYLVTTPDMIENVRPSWMTYLKQVSGLNSVEQKASEFIGVSEAYLSRKISGYGSGKTENEMSVVKRFYLTLMLYRIIQERSLWDVAHEFDMPRGFIQSLFSSSSSFASCLVHFTKELPEFHNVKLLLETIVDKLAYTAILELVPLMQIPGVKKARAKQLFTAGYRNLQAVAKADPITLVESIEHLPKSQARALVSSAKMLLLEKAEALQEEAADLIEA